MADKIKFENHMKVTMENGHTVELTRWTKGSHDRVYINDGSRNGLGWIDINDFEDDKKWQSGRRESLRKLHEMIYEMDFS